MTLVKLNIKRYECGYTLDDILKHIELCARTAYKSEDKITEDSSKQFVERIISLGHLSVLEHGTIYLTINISNEDVLNFYIDNKYSFVEINEDIAYITTNYRVIVENKRQNDLQYITSPSSIHITRSTIAVTTDRGTSHEIVRHRSLSFTQESTRFCNYQKEKFGNNVTYVIPSWSNIQPGTYTMNDDNLPWESSKDSLYYDGLLDNESDYFGLLNIGWKPEQARQILPNALKTDIVITGDKFAFDKFIDIRLNGKYGKPHKNIECLSRMIKEALK